MSKDNIIIVKFTGGLGNQLFQYSFYRWLKGQLPDKTVLADLSEYVIYRPHNSEFAWDIFNNIQIDKASNLQLFKISGQIPIMYGGKGGSRLNVVREKINGAFFRKKGCFLDINHNLPNNSIDAINSGVQYLEGYWQNVYYYEALCDLGGELKFDISEIVPYKDEISDDNAVAVHVRRGDYVGSDLEKDCSLDYYKRAIQYASNRITNPIFYFFSDDASYVERQFSWISNKVIVKGNDGSKSYHDMYLMSCCPCCIIANSTFSVWAAYLNSNDEKMVIYPDVPFMRKMIKDNWVGLAV